MNLKQISHVSTLLIALNACDRFYGTSRTVYLEQLPTTDCVVSALNSIPDTTNVSHSVEKGVRALTLHGLETANIIHRYQYQYQGIDNSFYIDVSPSGQIIMHQSYGCLNCDPPREILDKMSPVFLEVENALSKHCGVTAQLK